MKKRAFGLSLLFMFGSVTGQIKYVDDPMPTSERAKLPKPYILLEVSENQSCPMMDSVFISIGPNEHHICEVWLKKDFKKLAEIEEKWINIHGPIRAWI